MSLVFSDTTNEQGIVQDARYRVNANSTTYPIKDLTRNANRWYSRAVSIFLESDGRWQWDDTNWTDFPIGTVDLVSGKADYTAFLEPPEDGEDYLRIYRVRAKDENGNYYDLMPVDQADLRGTPVPESGATGKPLYYDKLGPSVFLLPTPSYSSSSGLQVYFQRAPSYFDPSDTAKRPGFPSIFHHYVSVGAAYDFAVTKSLKGAKVALLRDELAQIEQDIRSFMSKRAKDESVRLVSGQGRHGVPYGRSPGGTFSPFS